MPLDANEAELIRLREMLKWQTLVIGQLQGELRAERAIGDFWAAEKEREREGWSEVNPYSGDAWMAR